jgi:hypothetical protein
MIYVSRVFPHKEVVLSEWGKARVPQPYIWLLFLVQLIRRLGSLSRLALVTSYLSRVIDLVLETLSGAAEACARR